jgi:hypothetical protein
MKAILHPDARAPCDQLLLPSLLYPFIIPHFFLCSATQIHLAPHMALHSVLQGYAMPEPCSFPFLPHCLWLTRGAKGAPQTLGLLQEAQDPAVCPIPAPSTLLASVLLQASSLIPPPRGIDLWVSVPTGPGT